MRAVALQTVFLHRIMHMLRVRHPLLHVGVAHQTVLGSAPAPQEPLYIRLMGLMAESTLTRRKWLVGKLLQRHIVALAAQLLNRVGLDQELRARHMRIVACDASLLLHHLVLMLMPPNDVVAEGAGVVARSLQGVDVPPGIGGVACITGFAGDRAMDELSAGKRGMACGCHARCIGRQRRRRPRCPDDRRRGSRLGDGCGLGFLPAAPRAQGRHCQHQHGEAGASLCRDASGHFGGLWARLSITVPHLSTATLSSAVE